VIGAGGFNNSPNYEVSRDGRRILAVVDRGGARQTADRRRELEGSQALNWAA
jgi:hypothetical protein